jgi:succinate dehydrogenase flavin-adding protein (antitoxin of CptAB toxin-antitoxin module)
VATLCERVGAVLDATDKDLVPMASESRSMAEDCRTEIAQRVLFLTNGLKEVDPDLKGWIAAHGKGIAPPDGAA